jgi:hypothetical protein
MGPSFVSLRMESAFGPFRVEPAARPLRLDLGQDSL